MSLSHSNQSQILAEFGYKTRNQMRADVVNGIRSDGQPFAKRVKVSAQKRAQREINRRIEDIAIAKELGISLEELRGTL
ncbi:hypothetical protein [Shewanella baltica]|uniref:hypothetical protein n=1 Tax=Shewanella baltica TaxID=62322 RepID=UPI002166DEB8|nr:hypothetical protein [Shewanella baltica]MCS6115266.1 hypothetical protein [Shewanella baltica]UVW63696.1 hypothetical protein HHE93_08890 [Shewanella baltica]